MKHNFNSVWVALARLVEWTLWTISMRAFCEETEMHQISISLTSSQLSDGDMNMEILKVLFGMCEVMWTRCNAVKSMG